MVRQRAAKREIDGGRGHLALTDLADFPLRRRPHEFRLQRVWDLHNNRTAFDAVYLALAKTLEALLITRDRHVANAAGHRARVELV
jgi:predicted nucleic acid-binding protein